MSVISANATLCSYNRSAEDIFRNELKKRNINLQLNTRLASVDASSKTLSLLNSNDNSTMQKAYDGIYAISPTSPHEFLASAEICKPNGLISVNKCTL
jgi:thioredoxin reductase